MYEGTIDHRYHGLSPMARYIALSGLTGAVMIKFD
jgi:hypothetical protein